MKKIRFIIIICILLSRSISILYAQSTPGTQAPCKGYPVDQLCCQDNSGTWIISGSGGFCYMNLSLGSHSNEECVNDGGYVIKMNDGSRFCVPKGVKCLNGNIVFVNKKDQTILLVFNGTTYTIKTNDLKGMLKTEQSADVFYSVDPNGDMRATAIKSGKSKSIN